MNKVPAYMLVAVLVLGLSLVQIAVAQNPSIASFAATPYAFNSETGSTTLSYTLADVTNGTVSLNIQNSQAVLVRTLVTGVTQSSGDYTVIWDGKDDLSQAVPEGIHTAVLMVEGVNAQSNVLIDNTSPTITIKVPAKGASYSLNQPVVADYSCSDPGSTPSGVAPQNCVGTVPSGSSIDTSSVGPRTFAVTATDNAGNTATQTVTYKVGYKFNGFLPPLKAKPKKGLEFNGGSTIPVKFQLTDYNGQYISTAVAQIWFDSAPAKSAGNSNKGNYFRYDQADNQYIFNLKTAKVLKGQGPISHVISVTLDDGSVYSITITLR